LREMTHLFVVPAKSLPPNALIGGGNPAAFVAQFQHFQRHWIPASAGMTHHPFATSAPLRAPLVDGCVS
jgi:hypothetical protein